MKVESHNGRWLTELENTCGCCNNEIFHCLPSLPMPDKQKLSGKISFLSLEGGGIPGVMLGKPTVCLFHGLIDPYRDSYSIIKHNGVFAMYLDATRGDQNKSETASNWSLLIWALFPF